MEIYKLCVEWHVTLPVQIIYDSNQESSMFYRCPEAPYWTKAEAVVVFNHVYANLLCLFSVLIYRVTT